MSRLLVVIYPELRRAGEVLATLRNRHEKGLANLDEAIYVTRGESGDLELHQSVVLVHPDVVGDATLGLLISLLVSAPLLGGIVGEPAEVIGDNLAGLDIDEEFAVAVSAALSPGSSAIVALVPETRCDTVCAALDRHGGTILQATVSRSAQARLRAVLNAGRRA
jgi:uncharacterized membrane protein